MNNVIDFRSGNLFDKLYEHLALPDSTFLGTRITKKMILQNNDLSNSDKKLVNDVIQSVEWLNTLKSETLNIPTYVTETVEYIEVDVLKISLKADTRHREKLKSIAKLFHTLIPYPVIFLLELNGEVALSLADKRVNQADCSKLVIENYYNSRWFDIGNLKDNEIEFLCDFSLKNVSRVNYYELFQDFISKVIALEISYISGTYEIQEIPPAPDMLSDIENSNAIKKQLLNDLMLLKSELKNIRKKIKNETHMNIKLKLNIKAKKIKKEMSVIMEKII
ncbi:DUF4391 domain-containing protein [Vibrio alginolyticus]|uniref:DUF4391 domain-containing protein n=1 Tax=Vibrio alginolyticus TaxID=663 RepID=UPI001B824DFF|nr:DUF4391 domain-containing protein [Vibrio parahaemolyticus]